jgi:hypothetical protein
MGIFAKIWQKMAFLAQTTNNFGEKLDHNIGF